MDHFAGLDVSVKETSVCIVDDTGRIVREVKVASEPEALLAVLKNPSYHFKRIGLEAGPLSQWLYSALAEAGLAVICVETRHMQAVLKAQINKTDRNDARGIAQMMRVGLYRPVHVKTLRSQKLRMLLTHRKLLLSKAIDIENDLPASLATFGLTMGRSLWPRLCRSGSQRSVQRRLISSQAVPGKMVTSRASTHACVMNCSMAKSSTRCARPRSSSKVGGVTSIQSGRMNRSATSHQHQRCSCQHSPRGRLRYVDRLRRPRSRWRNGQL